MHYPHSPLFFVWQTCYIFDDYPDSVPYVRHMAALIKLCIISHVLSIEQGRYTVPSKKRPATGFARYVTTWKETNMFVLFVFCMTLPTLETLDAKHWITIKKTIPDEITYSFLKLKILYRSSFFWDWLPCLVCKSVWENHTEIYEVTLIKGIVSNIVMLLYWNMIQEPREWHVTEWHLMECNFPYMSIQ